MAGRRLAIRNPYSHSTHLKALSMTTIPWYDIAGMVFLACLCLYFGLAAGKFSPQARQKLPSFVFNQKLCFMLTGAFLLMALGKLLHWF